MYPRPNLNEASGLDRQCRAGPYPSASLSGEQQPATAKRAVKTIQSGVKILKRHPELGRFAEDGETHIREWLIPFSNGNYAVLYSIEDAGIILLAIRHGREAGYS